MSNPAAADWPAVTPIPSVLTLMLGTATELARAGEHGEVLRLLAVLGAEEGSIPAALDLLARIHAQQGRYAQAETLWGRAAELMPTNDTYQKALKHVRHVQRSRIALIYATPWLASGFKLMMAIAVLGLIGTVALRHPASTARHLPITAPGNASAVSEDSEPRITVDVPGIHQRIEGSVVVFVPDSGLFLPGSAALTTRAKGLLSSLGRQLEPYRDNLEIRVLGYTDDSPMMRNKRFKDNNALGMARAVAVYELLRWETKIPSVRLSLASGGDVGAPYLGSGEAIRARNRTVVLRVTKRR